MFFYSWTHTGVNYGAINLTVTSYCNQIVIRTGYRIDWQVMGSFDETGQWQRPQTKMNGKIVLPVASALV